MKISKIYSNKNFHNTQFNFGLNVIFADVKAKESPTSSHSIGKSKLIQLLDFLLLKKITPKQHFLTSTKDPETNTLKFNGYIFFLEILLNSGKYLTIKRTVAESSKVSMHLSDTTVNNFTPPSNWVHENITIDEGKEKLNEYLNFDFFKINADLDFRDTLNYSLRSPDDGDYNDLFKLKKFTFDEKKWKTFMFSLLGFDKTAVIEKYKVEEEIKLKKKVISEQEEGFNIHSNQKDELEGFVQVLSKSKSEKIIELDKLNFFNQDERLISNLVGDIETKIGELNKISYSLQFEIKKINESLNSGFSFDISLINELFDEIKSNFSDQLKKSYEELVEFNKQISSERMLLLQGTLAEKTEQLRETKIALIELHKEKEKYQDVIQDNTIIKKLKEYQGELIQLENEIARHDAKLDSIKVIESKRNEIEVLEAELKTAIQKLNKVLDTTSFNQRYKDIRNLFSDFAQAILNYQAIISVSKNSNNNVEYNFRIGETKKGDGNTYKKMLCVAFDLAILAEYSKESYFKFIYHDDVFSNQENKIRLRLMSLLREYCNKYNIQYILSIIKDDLPRDDKDNFIMFSPEEIIMHLSDKDDSGKLFNTSF